MQQPLHIQPPHTYSQESNKALKRRIERKMEDVLDKVIFISEEEKELGMQFRCQE
jgi:hypothetical protein